MSMGREVRRCWSVRPAEDRGNEAGGICSSRDEPAGLVLPRLLLIFYLFTLVCKNLELG